MTVVIPTVDRPEDTARAVRSALAQEGVELHVVVVDDGSSPPFASTLSTPDDPRVQILRHEVTRGASAARNTGMGAAQAPWIAFLDSDDEWEAGKLAAQVGRASKPDRPGLVLCGHDLVRTNGHRITSIPVEVRAGHAADLFGSGAAPTVTSCFLLDRSLADEGLRFDEALATLEDLDLAVHVASTRSIAVVPSVLVHKGIREDRLYSRHRAAASRRALLTKHLELFEGHPRAQAHQVMAAIGDGEAGGDVLTLLHRARRVRWSPGIELLLLLHRFTPGSVPRAATWLRRAGRVRPALLLRRARDRVSGR